MANYIITKHPEYFKFGNYNFCNLEDMILPDIIALDTETTGLTARDCDMFCCQIGTGTNNYIIHQYDDNYEFADVVPYLEGKTLIGHNILFDLGFMYKYGFYPEKVLDTMLASKILYNGDMHNLRADFGSVMYRELGVHYDKTDQKNIHIVKLSQPSTIEYSFNDVDRLIELHSVLEAKILKRGSKATYDLHCRYIKALAYMEQCGMPLDENYWKNKMIIDQNNVAASNTKINNYIYDNLPQFTMGQIDMFDDIKRTTIQLTSPKQMLKVFKALNINVVDPDGKESINEKIISKTKHEFVDMWLEFQEAQHRVSTFGENILNKMYNGRIYTSFNPMVDTARLSTRKGGINFLNFPADVHTRDCFRAKPGYKMIVCDYSAQEGVIMADLSGDKAMTASVVDGVDLHCLLAKAVFPELEGLSDDDISSKHKKKRSFVKPIRFAFSYGGNGFTIHQNLGIELKEAQRIETAFKELHAGLYEWGDKVLKEAIYNGYIDSVDGWKLKLPQYEKFLDYKFKVESLTKEDWAVYKIGKLERQAERLEEEKNHKDPTKVKYKIIDIKSYNFYKKNREIVSNFFKIKSGYSRLCLNNPVQTRGAHQLKLAMCYFFEWIVKNNYQGKVLLCNTIHDEGVAESIDKLADKTRIALQECMRKAGNHYLHTLTIQAEAHIGDSWYEAK